MVGVVGVRWFLFFLLFLFLLLFRGWFGTRIGTGIGPGIGPGIGQWVVFRQQRTVPKGLALEPFVAPPVVQVEQVATIFRRQLPDGFLWAFPKLIAVRQHHHGVATRHQLQLFPGTTVHKDHWPTKRDEDEVRTHLSHVSPVQPCNHATTINNHCRTGRTGHTHNK